MILNETNAFLSFATLSEERVRKERLIKIHVYSMLSVKKINYYNNTVILYKLILVLIQNGLVIGVKKITVIILSFLSFIFITLELNLNSFNIFV